MKDLTLYLIRHGETEWSKSGNHTGLTDIPLTENGKLQAQNLAKKLDQRPFDQVFASPLQRAFDTCKICGYDSQAIVTDALLEWDYGDYEGIPSKEIHQTIPNWNVFTHGAEGGESVEDVKKRVDHFIAHLSQFEGEIALFSSGHILRSLAMRWLHMPMEKGRHFPLSTASLSILGREHSYPALTLWNSNN